MNEYAKKYRAEFIEPGLISYEDIGAGTVLVGRPALDRMRKSFIGKPVVNFEHRDLTPGEAYKIDDSDKTSQADGIVTDVGTTGDGWDYADMLIWDVATQKNIDENGYSVSCSYTPSKVAEGGIHNNIPYDEEVIDGEYTHMAVVDNPRYEKATVYQNSKGNDMAKFKFFGKKQNAAPDPPTPPPGKDPEKKENMEEPMDMAGAVIEVDGEMIPVEEAINAYKQAKQNEVTPLSAEDTVDVEGQEIPVSELIAACQAIRKASNAEPPQDVVAEPVVDTSLQKQNSVQKKNKNFRLIQNSAQFPEIKKPLLNTRSRRLERGKANYGTIREVKHVG